MSLPRSYFLENLGCAKNQVDAEVMMAVLGRAEWWRVSDPADASVIVVNTCGFIEPAKEESINVVLSFRSDYPDAKVVMAGCLSQRYSSDLDTGLPEVDGIFGNRAPERVVEFLDRVLSGERTVYLPDRTGRYPNRPERLSFPGSAFVKVSEGCRNRCSFCAIPLIRGGLYSRPVEEIVDEIRALRDQGVFEMNLVAQDLSSYGLDRGNRDIMKLLEAIAALDGEFWIRMLYVYPETFPLEVLSLCREDPRFLPYFDIPFQHAAKGVLRRMGRPGSGPEYLDLVGSIRDALPYSIVRSTFLVGFVGETDEDFAELLRFQRSADLDWVGSFTYSVEDGTPAFAHRSEVPPATVAAHRKAVVDSAQEVITEKRLDRFVGRRLDVLVEELVEGEEVALARAYAHAPEVDGAVVLHTGDRAGPGRAIKPGAVIRAVITRRNGIDLEARPTA